MSSARTKTVKTVKTVKIDKQIDKRTLHYYFINIVPAVPALTSY